MDITVLEELAKFEATLSPTETGDPLWKLHAYRLARYLLALCLADLRDAHPPIPISIADQLRRAVSSIAANISEGYSRATAADRCRFYSCALGSVRESLVWYLSARRHLPAGQVEHRLRLIADTRRLVLGMVGSARRASLENRRRR